MPTPTLTSTSTSTPTPTPTTLTADRLTGRTQGAWPIEYEALGNPAHPAIVLIMGLGLQLVAWPDSFCQALVNGGYRVVRFDNRDCGLSKRAPAHGRFALLRTIGASVLKLPVPSPYTLDDIAQDTLAVMDALHIDRAHIVGVSMGGMIGQVLGAEHPQRVASLISIMSTSGHPRLQQPALSVRRVVVGRPAKPDDEESVIDNQVRIVRTIGSPVHHEPEQALRKRVGRGIRRAYEPAGLARQVMAIIASGDRRSLLKRITAPTLVIHGRDDPMVPLSGGQDTADHIPGAKLLVVDGMGHDLSPALLHTLSQAILDHCNAF
jgi:pimeloyl-ACP methyl ester carboxylesterase